jgi:hypothetical protein
MTKLITPPSTSASPQPIEPLKIVVGWPPLITSITPNSASAMNPNVGLSGRTCVRCQSTIAVISGESATMSDALSGRACASPVYARRLNPAKPSEPSQKRRRKCPSVRSARRPSTNQSTPIQSAAAIA